jgi:hypothetical protein
VWEIFDCVGDSFSVGCVYMALVAAIVFERGTKVPTKFSMAVPTSSMAWFFMDDHFGAWGHEWVSIVIIWTKECLVCRHVGLSLQRLQQVESDFCFCGNKLSQRWSGKSRCVEHSLATKRFLNVRMALSAALIIHTIVFDQHLFEGS